MYNYTIFKKGVRMKLDSNTKGQLLEIVNRYHNDLGCELHCYRARDELSYDVDSYFSNEHIYDSFVLEVRAACKNNNVIDFKCAKNGRFYFSFK